MVQVVGFHGPFGAQTVEGVKLRAAAMDELLEAGVGTRGESLGTCPHGIVIGDFNLDWAPEEQKQSSAQRVAKELYERFGQNGYKAMIEGGVRTSLVSIHGSAKWKQIKGTTTTAYTSSAYDNVFVKSAELEPYISSACVIDVVGWLAGRLQEFPLPLEDPQYAVVTQLTAIEQAFYLYRKYVSDHLPVLLDIAVAPMTAGAKKQALQREARGLEAWERLGQKTELKEFDVLLDYEECMAFEVVSSDRAESYLPLRALEAMEVVGTVVGYLDNEVAIVCRPSGSKKEHRLWAFAKSKGVAPDQLAKYHEQNFPPETRVRLVVQDWRYVEG